VNTSRLLCCVLLSCFSLIAKTQDSIQLQDIRFRNFDRRNGLQNLGLFNITRDSSGYIWLSGDGVTRYDGSEIKHFRKESGKPNSLRENYTDNLMVDKKGVLWIGGAGGLCCYEPGIDGFRYYHKSAAEKIIYAYAFVFDGKETLWFSSNLGLCKINTTTHKVSTTSLTGYSNPLTALIDHRGRVWVGTSFDGIKLYDPKTDQYTTVKLFDKDGRVSSAGAMTIDNREQVWIAKGKGLFRVNANAITDNQGHTIVEEMPALKDMNVCGFSTLPAYSGPDILWMASSAGLLCFNTATKKITARFAPVPENPYSILSTGVNAVYTDKEGQLWTTTIKGISMMNPNSQNFKRRLLTELTDQSDPYIMELAQDKEDKKIVWIATKMSGLLKYDWTKKQVLQSIQQFEPGPDPNNANTVADNGKGLLWIGSRNLVYCMVKKTGSIRKLPALPTEKLFDYRTAVHKILCIGDSILIFSSTGVVCYNPKTNKHRIVYSGKAADNMNLYNILYAMQDSDSTVWCGAVCGLVKINIRTNVASAFIGPPTNTGLPYLNGVAHLTNDGDRLLLSTISGVFSFDKNAHTLARLQLPAGVVNGFSNSVLIDSAKNYWIGSSQGILFVNRKKNTFRLFTTSDGLEENDSNLPLQWMGDQLVFKSRTSFTYFDPYSVENNKRLPQPVITAFRILESPRFFDPAVVQKEAYVLNHRENFISFDFNAFEFNYPDKVAFAYRLTGFRDEWINSGKKRTATYTNLSPGEYIFEMKAANSEGLWSNTTQFKLYIRPAFWQTALFKIAVALVLLSLLYALYKYRINQILKLQRVRNRISADLHDDIGSAISAVRISNAMAIRRVNERTYVGPLLDEMNEDLKKIGESLDDIVWNINTPASNWQDLLARMRRYAAQTLENSSIDYRLHFDEPRQELPLSLECRRDLFLIYKETVNNAVKHSGATLVTIKAQFNALNIILEITDNGKGFDTNRESLRNGLKNMKQRAANCKGKFEIVSSEGEGTRVVFSMKITQKS
jgi:signal transduction histidine kinase/ligand-binding sensor domain-containing protein